MRTSQFSRRGQLFLQTVLRLLHVAESMLIILFRCHCFAPGARFSVAPGWWTSEEMHSRCGSRFTDKLTPSIYPKYSNPRVNFSV